MAIIAKDFKIVNNDLHINIETGDFEIGKSDQQHVQDIINAFPGWYKEYPTVGVGIDYYRNSTGKDLVLKREIKVQLINDGYRIDDITISETLEVKTLGERIK